MPPKPLDGHWFFHVHGETFGPLSTEVVTILLRQHRLQFTDWAWCENMTRWTRVAEIDLFTAYLPQYPDAPIPTGAPAPASATAPPVAPLAPRPGLPPLGAPPAAGRPMPFAPLSRPAAQPMAPQPSMAPAFAGNAATAAAPMMAPTAAPAAPPHLEVVPPPAAPAPAPAPQGFAPPAAWPPQQPAPTPQNFQAPQNFAPPAPFPTPQAAPPAYAPPPTPPQQPQQAAPPSVMDLTAAPAAAPQPAPAPPAQAAPAPQVPPQAVRQQPPPPPEGEGDGDANQKAWIRRHTRVRLEGNVNVDGYGNFTAFDLSEGGLFIVANTPIPFGTDVKIRLESPAFPKAMDMTGIVIREGLSEAGEAGFAIQFTRVNPAHRRVIQDYVKQKLGQ